MTAEKFRQIALSLPEVVEGDHMRHPDFRVKGRIFATLGYPDEAWGMVKLTPRQQEEFVRSEPNVFSPVNGGWGKRGCTSVWLKAARVDPLHAAMSAAWQNAASAGAKTRRTKR